jgi:hypothetical protein
MKKITLFLTIILLTSCSNLSNTNAGWKIGAKIHFEEEGGKDYIGLRGINKITKDALKSTLKIHKDFVTNNSKILLKKDDDKIQMTNYEEKNIPSVGEEMHATLLYTKPRGFHDSETLQQICGALFKNCQNPPSLKKVAKKYSSIIKFDSKFQISEVILTKTSDGPSFIMAKLLLNEHENIYLGAKPISAGLHMTLINCTDDSILGDASTRTKLIRKLNNELKGKMIKISTKHRAVDLEFGISGELWRVRAGKVIRYNH